MNRKLFKLSNLLIYYFFSILLLVPSITLSYQNLKAYRFVNKKDAFAKDIVEINSIYDNLSSENIH